MLLMKLCHDILFVNRRNSLLFQNIYSLSLQRKDKGQVLLNKVLNEIDLNEDEYFGLCWRDKNGLRVSILHSKVLSSD